jgi:hypothetical protein
MRPGFTPIRLEDYVELYLKANPGSDRADVIKRLQHAIDAAKRGVRCRCGEPIWVIGSADTGLACFTCITLESHPTCDYEIDVGHMDD